MSAVGHKQTSKAVSDCVRISPQSRRFGLRLVMSVECHEQTLRLSQGLTYFGTSRRWHSVAFSVVKARIRATTKIEVDRKPRAIRDNRL
jgi:hypothetical protein